MSVHDEYAFAVLCTPPPPHRIIPVPAQLGAQLQFNHSDVYATMRKHGLMLDLSTLGADPHNRAYTEQEWQARARHIREAVGF